MIDPIAGLTLVIAQSPEVARAQMPTLQQIALANAQAPALAMQAERAAEDVASVQPARRTLPAGASEDGRPSHWSYTRHPGRSRSAAAASVEARLQGTLGLVLDLAA